MTNAELPEKRPGVGKQDERENTQAIPEAALKRRASDVMTYTEFQKYAMNNISLSKSISKFY